MGISTSSDIAETEKRIKDAEQKAFEDEESKKDINPDEEKN